MLHEPKQDIQPKRTVSKGERVYQAWMLSLLLIEAASVYNFARISTEVNPRMIQAAAIEIPNPSNEEVEAAQQFLSEYRRAVITFAQDEEYEQVDELVSPEYAYRDDLEAAQIVIEQEETFDKKWRELRNQEISGFEDLATALGLISPIFLGLLTKIMTLGVPRSRQISIHPTKKS